MEEDLYFYHSFPKGYYYKRSIEKEIGIKILESICTIGFILAPEVVNWKKSIGIETEPHNIRQQRICFTLLNPREVKGHSKEFGRFSIEFNTDVLRNIGAMPVFYVPKGIETNESPSIFMIDKILKALNIMNLFDSTISFGIKALLGYLYPADDEYEELKNYRLKEWRITGNTLLNYIRKKENLSKKDIDLAEYEKNKLIEINHQFFTEYIGEAKKFRRVDKCMKLYKFNSKHVLNYANRIIVPDDVEKETRKIVEKNNIDCAVTSLSCLNRENV